MAQSSPAVAGLSKAYGGYLDKGSGKVRQIPPGVRRTAAPACSDRGHGPGASIQPPNATNRPSHHKTSVHSDTCWTEAASNAFHSSCDPRRIDIFCRSLGQ